MTKSTTRSKGFVGNTMSLIFGNVGAQTINFITIPIITRLYTPDSYGIMALFLAVSMVVVEISCLRFEFVILLPKETKDSANIVVLCIIFCLFFSLSAGGAGLFLNITDVNLFKPYKEFFSYFYFITIFIFLSSVYKILNFWSIRHDMFKVLGLSSAVNALSNKSSSIIYGFLIGSGPLGLILGLILGSAFSGLLLFFRTIKNEIKNIIETVSVEELKKYAIRYRSFAFYSPAALLEIFSREIAPLFLGLFFGPAVVGFFGLSKRVVQQPLGVLGDSISRSFFHKISVLHRNGESYAKQAEDLFRCMLSLALVPVLLLAIVSPDIFGLIFGSEWKIAGTYLSILSFTFLSLFLYRPFSIILDVLEKQKFRFFLNLFRAVISGTALYAGTFFGSVFHSLIFYSMSLALLNFSIITLMLNYAGSSYLTTLKVTCSRVCIAIIIATVLYLVKTTWAPENLWLLLGVAGFLCFSHTAAVISMEPKLYSALFSMLKKTPN